MHACSDVERKIHTVCSFMPLLILPCFKINSKMIKHANHSLRLSTFSCLSCTKMVCIFALIAHESRGISRNGSQPEKQNRISGIEYCACTLIFSRDR